MSEFIDYQHLEGDIRRSFEASWDSIEHLLQAIDMIEDTFENSAQNPTYEYQHKKPGNCQKINHLHGYILRKEGIPVILTKVAIPESFTKRFSMPHSTHWFLEFEDFIIDAAIGQFTQNRYLDLFIHENDKTLLISKKEDLPRNHFYSIYSNDVKAQDQFKSRLQFTFPEQNDLLNQFYKKHKQLELVS